MMPIGLTHVVYHLQRPSVSHPITSELALSWRRSSAASCPASPWRATHVDMVIPVCPREASWADIMAQFPYGRLDSPRRHARAGKRRRGGPHTPV